MFQVKIGQFRFGEDAFTLRYVLAAEQPVKFVAKDIASSLKYGNCNDAVSKHVDKKYKYTYGEQACINISKENRVKQGDPLYLSPQTILIDKIGVIQLFMRSKLHNAAELQNWFYERVLPQCTARQSALSLLQDAQATVVFNSAPVQGHFYAATTLLYAERNLFKIGQTTNLTRRLAALNCGRADDDQMRYVLQTEPTAHHTLLEKLMKQELRPYRNSGEVYCTDFEHIKRALESCLRRCSQN
uniref:BRO-J n=1 Tax=Lymantria dispar multicapsid nuclear polyhedrosis virus TaxID=10449 RepID=A0A4P8NIE7_NPVLD|nr:BRO-J [Lymantria dispar multiple nucleopolyhedrovirus]QCQ67525.1 BRO-J [Lymantria dispar multiple nucleopolyhedrovirus]QCQ67684.1 BRO-J [Lymantria dispar multiple nucleopolyhedrovirus]